MSLFKSLFGKSPPKQIVVQPGGERFAVDSGQTVLERALKEGLAYPHDCTVGTCGSCRTKLLAGQVEAITPFGYTLSKDELDAGYILACQAIPKSDLLLEVDIGSDAAIAPMSCAARLVGIDDLTHDIKRLRFVADAPVRYRAGQYLNLRWNGGEAHRSYSFAAAPTADGSTDLTTFVRHVPGGQFTDLLFTGDPLSAHYEIDAPHGNFWLRDGAADKKAPMICIAGGSGLAPLISLLQDAAERRVRRDCVLLFGGRGARDLYVLDEIAAIRNAWTAGFDYWPILSEEAHDQYRHGMVTEHVAAALEKLGPGAHGYMCGPPPMIDAGIHALTEAGIALEHIYYDKFTDASTRG